MTKPNKATVTRTINRFRDAVTNAAFEGTIPVFSDDREEQALLDAAHWRIGNDLAKAEAALRKLIEREPKA